MTKVMKQKIKLLYVLALFVSVTALGQSKGKLYKQGIIAFYEENFKAAEYYFNQVLESGKDYKDAEYRLQISKLVQNQYRDEPIDPMLNFQDQEKKDKFYHYWMGRIYANKYMFAEAVDSWNKFLSTNSKKSNEIVKETGGFIKHSKDLVDFFDNPGNFEIHQLGAPINTEYAETSPVFMLERDELIFSSNRDNPKKDEFKIYEAENTEDGWKTPVAIEVAGTYKRNLASVQLVDDNKKLFTFKKINSGSLFFSERRESGWSVPKEFDAAVSSADIESHFYINEHQDRILFAKNNKRSRTGFDIMQSFKNVETGEWEPAHSISDDINTPYNEDSPFMSADEKTLYFTSDRPNGVGGMDVYRCTLDEETNTWSEPENLGWPINSPDDDIHFKMNPDGKSGYFSSNRLHTTGDFDIYFFWKVNKTKVEGRVVDGQTNEPVRQGEIRFQPSQYLDEYFRAPIGPDGKYSVEVIANETFRVEAHIGIDTLFLTKFDLVTPEGEKTTHFKDFYINTTTANSLTAENVAALNDEIVATQQGETFGKTNTSGKSNNTNNYPNNNTNDSDYTQLTVGNQNDSRSKDEIEVSNTPTNFSRRNVVLRNLYFEFGTSTLQKESEARLQEVYDYLISNSNKRIEISGHTDNIGSKQTNLLVSQQRAESVKKWLVNKGISAERIVTNGYGESRPLASNDDEKNGRELNRRIEINIID